MVTKESEYEDCCLASHAQLIEFIHMLKELWRTPSNLVTSRITREVETENFRASI